MDDMGIMIENVSFSYEDKKVLDNITLSVQIGESVGIVGTSGGGKSTLLKLISGLYDVQVGEIRVMSARTSADRRRNVAMVMQSAALFPVSIRDNITCGHTMDEAAIRRACNAAQLSEWISTLPDGIDTFVGERGGKVSGGQAQRIAIARAIAKNAPVILLDEPTSALDGETSTAVIAALAELTKGKTVLNVSHRPETLVGCGRIFSMDGGRLYAQ
jgi:ATP-binding cassette subfamily B protein/subfamily B ATP-binding cassette protein MsbA